MRSGGAYDYTLIILLSFLGVYIFKRWSLGVLALVLQTPDNYSKSREITAPSAPATHRQQRDLGLEGGVAQLHHF